MDKIRLSKTMSYILRHHPEDFNLELNPDGTVRVEKLLEALSTKFKNITRQDLAEVVEEDEKGRFSFKEGGEKIRANYGHSIGGVDPDYQAVVPPEILYHGTTRKVKDKILKEGLRPMNRNYTHLSETCQEAVKVGQRWDNKPVIFKIKAGKAHADGHEFYRTGEGIYLTDWVPAKYLYLK
ncbi:MAG: RNA 2'-phosphotransferase [Halanaerobiales bacterium]